MKKNNHSPQKQYASPGRKPDFSPKSAAEPATPRKKVEANRTASSTRPPARAENARPKQLYALAAHQRRITVIGGGASGMMAAISAAQAAAAAPKEAVQVVLLEKSPRPGRKLLATGNGRCNITNTDLGAANYFTQSPLQLTELMHSCRSGTAHTLLQQLGLLCSAPEDGRIYPWCEQASAVLDILRAALDRLQVVQLCCCPVTDIRPTAIGFAVTVGGSGLDGVPAPAFTFFSDAVILSAGGGAAPTLGGCEDGFSLAARLGHTVISPQPALTALRSALPYRDTDGRTVDLLPGLKGIRCQAVAELHCQNTVVARQQGELQLGDGSLSGIPVLQLSLYYQQNTDQNLVINLLPRLSRQQLLALLSRRRANLPNLTLEEFLIGTVHKKLGLAVMKLAGLAPLSRTVGSLSDTQLSDLAHTLQELKLPVTGTLGWEGAQTTRGGVALGELDRDCGSVLHPGLYLTGEVLDVAGQCGGYNLDWAFCTGFRAGAAAFSHFFE